jgi:hypothetical protein
MALIAIHGVGPTVLTAVGFSAESIFAVCPDLAGYDTLGMEQLVSIGNEDLVAPVAPQVGKQPQTSRKLPAVLDSLSRHAR